MIMDEIWKDIEGYEGLYQVSNLGRVKSLKRQVVDTVGFRIVPESYLRGRLRYGYRIVSLCKHGEINRCMVHRLVAKAFIPNPENKPTVNHIDGVRNNNIVTNLEWATYRDQQLHKYRVLHSKKGRAYLGKLGKEHNKSKTVYQILNNKIIAEFGSTREAERETQIDSSSIARCCNGKQKTAGGFNWKYKERDG
jgi:hypothetical protein